MNRRTPLLLASICAVRLLPADEAAKIIAGHSPGGAGFSVEPVPAPAINDAAQDATFTLVDGSRDRNGGSLDVLHDGKVPSGEDDPAANFFFAGGTKRGRLAVDLGKVISVQAVTSYSWHPGVRGPQVYHLYGSDGTAKEFNNAPGEAVDPATCGWKRLARVDTREKGGGQHAVSVSASQGPLGSYRYLLFEIQPTSDRDVFGQTFFSEIDVQDSAGPPLERIRAEALKEKILRTYPSPDRKYKFVVDTTVAPDLTEWAEKKLIPVVHEWYPKVVALLPSDGFTAPAEVMLQFKDDMRGVPAYAAGNQVSLNAPWFRRELDREARGAVVHELVHVVQAYGRARLTNRRPARNPGWIVEGIPDYIRWFLYEPESKGAEITARNIERVKFDDSYRVSANFLNWVNGAYPKEIIRSLNTACREGRYSPDLWKEWTGRTVEELGGEWKKACAEKLEKKP